MEIKIRIKELTISIYLVLLCFFAIAIDYLELTWPLTIQYVFIVLTAFSFVAIMLTGKCKVNKDIYSFLVIAMMIIVMFRNELIRSYCIYILTLMLLLISRSVEVHHFEKILKILGICYIVFALATIFLYFNEAVYMSYIVPLFPTYSREMQYCYSIGYMTGLTANYARNSSMLSIGLIIICSQLCNRSKRIMWSQRNIFRYLIIVVFLVALVMSCKRAHTLFMLITVLFCLYLYMSNKPNSRWLKLIGLIIGIIVFGSILATNNEQFSNLLNRFSNLTEDEAVQNRFAIWAIALRVFIQNPIIGIGWGNFMAYTEEYLSNSWNAHNMFLQLLCETGLIGTLIFMSFILSIFYKSVQMFIRLRKGYISLDKNAESNLMFSIGIQTFSLLYCLTGSPLTDIRIYIPYFLGCSITLNYLNKVRKKKL